MKQLTRTEMKKIVGGVENEGDPGSPDEGLQGSWGSRKCCWTGTTNCSSCANCYGDAKCTAGATLTGC